RPCKSCHSETIIGYNTGAMLNRLCCAIVSAGVPALFLCLTVVGQTYSVRLTRPWKAGDRYRVIASGSRSQRSSTTMGRVARDTTVHDAVSGHNLELGPAAEFLSFPSTWDIFAPTGKLNLVPQLGSSTGIYGGDGRITNAV